MKIELESTVKHSELQISEAEIKTRIDSVMKKIAMAYPPWAQVSIKVDIVAKHE